MSLNKLQETKQRQRNVYFSFRTRSLKNTVDVTVVRIIALDKHVFKVKFD